MGAWFDPYTEQGEPFARPGRYEMDTQILGIPLKEIENITDASDVWLRVTRDEGGGRMYQFYTKRIASLSNGERYEQYVLILQFSLSPLYTSTRLILSGHMYVGEDYRRLGLGSWAMRLKRAIAIEIGATCMLAEVNVKNTPEICLLHKEGWHLLHTIDENTDLWAYVL